MDVGTVERPVLTSFETATVSMRCRLTDPLILHRLQSKALAKKLGEIFSMRSQLEPANEEIMHQWSNENGQILHVQPMAPVPQFRAT